MSDAPQQTGPDLHAIFGIDSEEDRAPEHTVEIDHATEIAIDGRRRARRAVDVDLPVEVDPTAGKRAVDGHHQPLAPGLLAALS